MSGPPPRETRRIIRWISDAFAVLCVRTSGRSKAEKQLCLGFEAILRELGSSPLHAITSSPLPAYAPPSATSGDLRLILHALDSCLATFARYEAVLDATQRRIEARMRETRMYALAALAARGARRAEASSPSSANPATAREETRSLVGRETPLDVLSAPVYSNASTAVTG